MLHFFLRKSEKLEYCFNVETSAPLDSKELSILRQLLADGFIAESVSSKPIHSDGRDAVELGPRMNFATAYSTNIVAICQTCGLEKVTRIERSRRYLLSSEADMVRFIREHHDRMTECLYDQPLQTFETGILPEPVFEIPLLEKGPDALLEIPGLAMDEWDRNLYYDYFVKEEGRNPTIVEIRDLDNANSEHSRHGYFKGRQIISGVVMPETLLNIVKSTLSANPSNSLIAFKDNSSGIKGYDCWTILPEQPGKPAPFKKEKVQYHIIFTAETHNFPTGVAPFPGAETGTGGRIRDVQATGRGGLVVAGTAAYCVANFLGRTRILSICRTWLLPSRSKSGQATVPAITAISSASPLSLVLQGPLTRSFRVASAGHGLSRLCSQAALGRSMPDILRRVKPKREC